MNVGDILINFNLLEEQYRFIVKKYELDLGYGIDTEDEDMWLGILNLLETILDFRQPLDNPAENL